MSTVSFPSSPPPNAEDVDGASSDDERSGEDMGDGEEDEGDEGEGDEDEGDEDEGSQNNLNQQKLAIIAQHVGSARSRSALSKAAGAGSRKK